ncbi:hypothetical protein BKA70DRAFT_513744 [Coprinopsis sp. MPI-PUGE-AT-0042]|nr:hypothetical protein BKA70DRAFT_513744 [Coprinopsis sp. MPI-PUGE-AT-0042]
MPGLPLIGSLFMGHLQNATKLMGITPGTAMGLASLLGYLSLVRLLRWQRYNEVHRQYASRFNVKTKKWDITPQEAQKIMQVSSAYDMPKLLNSALSFALFKTYAIPTISKLLYATKEFSSQERVAKRYADTEILIATFVGCPMNGFHDLSVQPDGKTPAQDPRAMLALARVNYLHGRYKISNDNYLYTLALFVLEPRAWAKRFGWRSLSSLEAEAYFVCWRELGNRMAIRDIPDSLEELEAWSTAYEEEHMVPSETNRLVAHYTTAELIAAIPEAFGLRRFVERCTTCLLEDRVRSAMLQPVQPWYMHAFVKGALHLVGFVQHYLCLPRRSPSFPAHLHLPKDMAERVHPPVYRSRPWYMAELTGLGYLHHRILVAVGYYSAMPSKDLRSGGFRLEEMGPLHLEKTARSQVIQEAERLQGCPVSDMYKLLD